MDGRFLINLIAVYTVEAAFHSTSAILGAMLAR